MRKFKKVYIEITSLCNLACSFCPQTGRKAQFIGTDDFRGILRQIKPHTDFIYLHVKGEPLLHPKLDELLDISHEMGFKVNITTNGTLIGKARSKLMAKPALRQMNFSLHSYGEQKESAAREEYMSQVLSFAKEAASLMKVYISLRFWNLGETELADEAGGTGRNRPLLERIEQEFQLGFKIEEKVTPGKGVKVAERIYVNQDHEFAWPSLDAPEDEGIGFCHALRNQAAVLVDGTVVPCCLDGEGVIRLGNLNETAFSDIVEGERANRLYDGFTRREAAEELCRKCGYRTRFGGLQE